MTVTPDSTTPARWTYVQILVIDGDRRLRPTHVCGTEIRFNEPPRLTSGQITIITRNGDRQTTRRARVLAHQEDARVIPIELTDAMTDEKAATRLTA